MRRQQIRPGGRWRALGGMALAWTLSGHGIAPADSGAAPAAPRPAAVRFGDVDPATMQAPAGAEQAPSSGAPPTNPYSALTPGVVPGVAKDMQPSANGAPGPAVCAEGAPKLPIDLPYALRLVNASNPTIAVAQARVQEAYAAYQRACVAWIPNLWAGSNPENLTFLPNYYVHNGLVQNSRGEVFSVVKASVALPVGAGLNLSTADALFGPRIARNLVAAEAARSRVVVYNVQLDVALTYLDLLRAYGALAINAETLAMAETMDRYAEQAVREGLGKTTADANRARTEVQLRRQERNDLEGQAAAASARLAQLLLLEPTVDLVPADAAILPIELVPVNAALDELVGVGLLNRPELAESRALVAAALARWREDRTRPLLPNLQLAFYRSQFGAGVPAPHTYGERDDFFLQANWELRNGGLGNWFEARESRARYSAANFRVAEVQAQVAAEVTAAAKVARSRRLALRQAEEAVRQAEMMWARLSRAAFGLAGPARKYDPIEPLLAEQALHEARLQYLTEVIAYNREQFRLFWAMGQPPIDALPKACALPVQQSVIPPPYKEPEPLKVPPPAGPMPPS